MEDNNQSQQQAAQHQKSLLAEALERARTDGGAFLNQAGKAAPKLYPRETGVSAFNALILALYSDRNGFKTNLYTDYNAAKNRGEGVLTGERGVPFFWYRWNEYRSKSDENRIIPKAEYDKLTEEQKGDYSPVRDRQVRTLFNIEQTTLPLVDETAFNKAIREHGSPEGWNGTAEDKRTRIEVNLLLDKLSGNLAPIRKDGIGIAHYDASKDVIHLPAQKHYDSYPEYVQEALRQVISATGHPQRLDRPGLKTEEGRTPSEAQSDRERLVVELASAVKMNQLGLPARIAYENIPLIERWEKSLGQNPRFIDALEADVNNAVNMIAKAERGEKIEKKPVPVREEKAAESVNARLSMIQDDDGKWALFLKPDGEKGFAVYPEKADVGRFFAMAKRGAEENQSFRQQLTQKYYALGKEHPEMRADLFSTREKDVDLSAIQRVSIIQTKENKAANEPRKILCYPVIKGMERVEAREVSPAQWQRMWLTDDKEAYKKNLAATLFADILRQRGQAEAEKQHEEKRMNSPEQKVREQREEKAKEALPRAETGIVAAVVAGAIAKQETEEQSRGFHR